MVVQQFINLCHSLQVSNSGRVLFTDNMAEINKYSFKTYSDIYNSCSRLKYMKGMEIKQNIQNFQDLKKDVHSTACVSKTNHTTLNQFWF